MQLYVYMHYSRVHYCSLDYSVYDVPEPGSLSTVDEVCLHFSLQHTRHAKGVFQGPPLPGLRPPRCSRSMIW